MTRPPPAPEAEQPGTLGRVWSVLGSVVAPATFVTAILFYFGYVSTRAQYLYFGVDVDLLGYSTQEFVMRSPGPLLVPMLGMLVVGAGLVLADAALRRRLAEAPEPVARRWTRGLGLGGSAVLTVGVVLLLAYPALGAWSYYPLVTPLVIGAGAAALAYGLTWARRHPPGDPPGHPPGDGAARGPRPAGPDPARTATLLLVLTVIAALFWATGTVAEWAGRGQAKELARDLGSLPAVVVDTPQRLQVGDPAVTEEDLAAGDGEYRFRYRGLRLLVEGGGTLFLVPERWSPHGSTLVVPLDDVRVKLRFVNDPP
ncbi:hypothetical protein GCM10009809_19760 [Isoptericola hypogeus]|uniref:Uncharacterized protein n=1 Tax=Isoptericola hypogeus TaxID=300179 RepID=A0ABN2JE89_9MICO